MMGGGFFVENADLRFLRKKTKTNEPGHASLAGRLKKIAPAKD
jgi:hypothetical protein